MNIYLDSNIWIYDAEENTEFLALEVFEKISLIQAQIICSPLTISECLSGPLKDNKHELINLYSTLFNTSNNITFEIIDKHLGFGIAHVVATSKLKTIDATHIATAVSGDCKFFITEDKQILKLKKFENVKIITPQEFLKSKL